MKKKSLSRKPTTRRKSSGVAKRRKTTRRRGLSQNIPVLGPLSLRNPIIGGAVGGAIGMALKNMIPDDPFGSPDSDKSDGFYATIRPYIKGGLILGASIVARNMKQPEVASGLASVGTALVLQRLNVPGLSAGMTPTRYADPRLLSDTALLSDDIYPDYTPMYETALLSSRR